MWSAPAGLASRPRLSISAPTMKTCRWDPKFGKRTCKPNSVVCGHSSRRRVAADTHQRPTRRFRQLLEAPHRRRPVAGDPARAAWAHRADAQRRLALEGASLPIWSCSVWGLPCPGLYRTGGALLPHHFTLTPTLGQQAGSGWPKPLPERGSRGGIFSVALAVCAP
jgi:hypothetical protein